MGQATEGGADAAATSREAIVGDVLWRPCGVAWNYFRTVVVIKLWQTSALTKATLAVFFAIFLATSHTFPGFGRCQSSFGETKTTYLHAAISMFHLKHLH